MDSISSRSGTRKVSHKWPAHVGINSSWTANNTKYFRFLCSATVFEGEKKRFVYLIAEGKDEKDRESGECRYITRTVFDIVSTRNDIIGHYVVSGMPESGTNLSSDKDLGKWLPIKNRMYNELLQMVKGIAGKDPYAQSIDLLTKLRDALNTTIMDELFFSIEQDNNAGD